MLICTGCGELVQKAQLKRVREPHGEVFLACPVCGDTCIDAVQCDCGDWHHPEDLHPGGYCDICLCDAITIDLAEEYIEEIGQKETFYIDFWLNGRTYLLDLLSKFFHSKPEIEQRDKLRDYIFATKYGPVSFAQWLEDRGGLNGS